MDLPRAEGLPGSGPRVLEVDGGPKWVVDGAVLGRAGASGVVTRDGERIRGTEFIGWTFDDVTPAAYQVEARLELMDRLGVWAHIIYPNTAGFGGQRFGDIKDPVLKLLCATLYNDAMAEMQEASGRRLFPMGLIPWWDIDASVAEVRRMNSLGLRGVNTTSDPQQAGLPDFADRAWDPLWEVCADLGMPVNFHIGAAHDSLSWFGSSLAGPGSRAEARGGLGHDVPDQRAGAGQFHLLGCAGTPSPAEDRLGGERHRLDPVLPGGSGAPAG
nr:hypothetical protein GCM10020093_006440 [Planobispora longispora]